MKNANAASIRDMKKNCEHVSGVLKALAHPQRLMILCHLAEGEKTVGELQELCTLSQSAVSQFLKRMKLENLIDSEKRGLFVHYRIVDPDVKKLMNSLYGIFCR